MLPSDAPAAPPATPSIAPTLDTDPMEWQPLPVRARALFVVATAVPLALAGGVGGAIVTSATGAAPGWIGAMALAATTGLLGAWWGLKQFRHTAWRLDAQGLGLRRGRLWHSETRVPATRVQHLDLKRGPLQRRRHLSTLVVHTAGTRHSAVTVHHLDADDAERLRDALAVQIDPDDET